MPGDPPGASALRASQHQASRSFLADILLPDTTAVAQDFLYQSWQHDRAGAAGGLAPDSEFHDAESFLGSIRSGLSSFVSASASGVAQGASFFSAASGESRISGWLMADSLKGGCGCPSLQQPHELEGAQGCQRGLHITFSPMRKAAPSQLAVEYPACPTRL